MRKFCLTIDNIGSTIVEASDPEAAARDFVAKELNSAKVSGDPRFKMMALASCAEMTDPNDTKDMWIILMIDFGLNEAQVIGINQGHIPF